MQVTRNVFTINDLNNWFDEKTLVINRDYQREGGIWVLNARSYFIDTILNAYPFPKMTIRQIIDLRTRKTLREIIDGQQRMMAINAFISSQLTLSSVSEQFAGQKFSDLNPEVQEAFLRYEVSTDIVISATEEEVLEIFRRMNSYTIPLNPSEQRHATFQGLFKWFIRDLIKLYSPMFLAFKIISTKGLSRMADADLMTELTQIFMTGIVGRNAKALNEIYKKNDKIFADRQTIQQKLETTLNYIKDALTPIGESGYLTGYMLYSLVAALSINRYENINVENDYLNEFEPIGFFDVNRQLAIQNVLELFSALDSSVNHPDYEEFVIACRKSTDSLKQRQVRIKWLIKALRNDL